jgi:hypothetical protein
MTVASAKAAKCQQANPSGSEQSHGGGFGHRRDKELKVVRVISNSETAKTIRRAVGVEVLSAKIVYRQ